MYHRTGRALTVTALVAASATVAAVVSSTTATAAPAAAPTARAADGGSAFGHPSLDLRARATQGAPNPLREAATSSAAASITPSTYPFRITTLTKDVVGPLQIAVGPRSRVYVADGFAGLLTRIGDKKPLFVAPQGSGVGGIDVTRDGSYAFTWGNQEKGQGYLTIRRPKAKAVTANLGAYERKYNPDAKNDYGAQSTDKCVLDALTFPDGPPARYGGIVDTNPYAVKAVPGGWVVADAAANTLLFVNSKGKVKTLAVLPPQPFVITAAFAAAQKLPDCTIGVTYNFEPVPTDVEIGHGGKLYVTTLPGGPEDASAPARGSVWSIGLNGKGLTRVATGFAGATNLAVTPSGQVLVAELFAGRISRAYRGRAVPVLDLPNVASVEFAGNAIYAGTLAPFGEMGPTGPGSVVRIDVRW